MQAKKNPGKSGVKISIDKDNSPSHMISPFDHIQTWFTFTFLGFIALFGWNSILNVAYDIFGYIYFDITLADTVILVYEGFGLAIYLFLLTKGGVRPKLLITACFVGGTCLLVIPAILQIWGNGSTTGIVLFHISVIPLSLCIGCFQGIGFSISSTLPRNYGGFIGFGQGISGIGSFLFYLFSDRILFPRDPVHSEHTRSQLTKTSWFLFGCGSVCTYFCGFLIIILSKKKWYTERIAIYWQEFSKENSKVEGSPKDESEIPMMYRSARKVIYILKDCWPQLVNSSVTLFITLFLFPLIGPYAWVGTTQNDLNVGVFQICDFIGRYLPVLAALRINKRYLIIITFIRFVFIPIFTISAFYTSLTFFNEFWFQALMMTIFSISNGWIATQTMIFIPEYVERIKEKGRVGTYNGASITTGVFFGLYGSKLYKILLDAAFGMSSQISPQALVDS